MAPPEHIPAGVPVKRRRIFQALGASGLASAVAVFGRSPKASAAVTPDYTVYCCDLSFAPSHNLTECQSGNHYTWTCSGGGGNHLICYCCEHKNSSGVTVYSSYSCYSA